jgi:hypothetical protein
MTIETAVFVFAAGSILVAVLIWHLPAGGLVKFKTTSTRCSRSSTGCF